MPVGSTSQQFEIATKEQDQSRIRQLADRDGSQKRQERGER